MEGLAQQLAGPQQQQADPAMIQKVIELLMQGVDPEKLVAQGVPPEVVMQAIDIIEQQMGQQGAPQQQQAADMGQEQGLAQSMMSM